MAKELASRVNSVPDVWPLELLHSRSCIWGFVAAFVISLLHVYPLLVLWHERGRDYNGYYTFQQYDEEAYAGYINSLILDRSRLSDPMQCGTTSEYESLFSIQFVPAYIIALPARALGITPSTAFILAGLICAFVSALAIYVLINDLTNNSIIAAASAVCVLCLGTILSSQGLMAHLRR